VARWRAWSWPRTGSSAAPRTAALALAGDAEVSARHARLFVQERRLLLEDLGSTNGTWLNGVRVLAPTPVREGDVLRCGQTELRLTGIGVA
jgi:pSer/pThr/pTyr-binding forkhead associated (FHA) protein